MFDSPFKGIKVCRRYLMVTKVPGAAGCLNSREKPSIWEPVAWKQSQCKNMQKHNVAFQLKWNGKCCPAVLTVHEVIGRAICSFSAGCGAGERTADRERELQKGQAWFIGWSHNFDKLTNRVTSPSTRASGRTAAVWVGREKTGSGDPFLSFLIHGSSILTHMKS